MWPCMQDKAKHIRAHRSKSCWKSPWGYMQSLYQDLYNPWRPEKTYGPLPCTEPNILPLKCSINNLNWFRDIWGARLFDQGQDDCGLWRVWFQVHRMQLQLSEWQKHAKPHRIPPCIFLRCPVQLVSESLSHQGSLKKAHQSSSQIYRIKHFLKARIKHLIQIYFFPILQILTLFLLRWAERSN